MYQFITATANPSAIVGLAFHSDGKRLASAGTDKTINFWDTSTGEELFQIALDGPGMNELATGLLSRRER